MGVGALVVAIVDATVCYRTLRRDLPCVGGVVAIVDATICHRTLRRDPPRPKLMMVLGTYRVESPLSAMI